ncbi:MAG TPA: phospholipase [Lentisphaeria bacterium]|nr:MAG: phospholipase [Lentisphaerae bacterium GWF2_50_93]HCE45223.1 phospholipase [Lentisphaeria bacterium]
MIKFVQDREIYLEVIRDLVPTTSRQLCIATADIKDMYIERGAGEKIPFLQLLASLIERGVEVHLIHAKEPGPIFRKDFDRFPALFKGLKRVLCPRVHFKCIIIDGKLAYFGSANLTGAGMGAKGSTKHNFENGVITDNPELVAAQKTQFDQVWRGAHCPKCGRRKFCSDCPIASRDFKKL